MRRRDETVAPKPRAFLMPWVVAVIATTVALVLHLAVRFETIRLGYRVGELRGEHRELVEKKRLLSLEVATWSEVPRIKRIAEHVLEMHPPREAQLRVLREAAARQDPR